jgi:anhydro-N-acetylmuramic acid kinase
MKLLRSNLLAPVLVAEAVGWSADALEAQAFAYLAVRSLKGLPLTFPTTTGVTSPMTGGVLAKP